MEDSKKTILTMQHYDIKTSVELPVDAPLYDIIQAFYACCVSATWNHSSILDAMQEWLDVKKSLENVTKE